MNLTYFEGGGEGRGSTKIEQVRKLSGTGSKFVPSVSILLSLLTLYFHKVRGEGLLSSQSFSVFVNFLSSGTMVYPKMTYCIVSSSDFFY